jgi:hypothetical protein
MAISINYQKRKNKELFHSLETCDGIQLSNMQNYVPIYKNFFSLNETNYNSINLNNTWSIFDLSESASTTHGSRKNARNAIIKKTGEETSKRVDVFFKMAPLLNPFKYLTGKYATEPYDIFKLPSFTNNDAVNPSMLDNNNSAYVDGCFTFLSSFLIHEHGFINGVDYYGSFLGNKNGFQVDVIEDLEHLISSEFFKKNTGSLFTIEDYSHIIEDAPLEKEKLNPIQIHDIEVDPNASPIDNEMYDGVFDSPVLSSSVSISLDDLKDMSLELVDVTSIMEVPSEGGQTPKKASCVLTSSSCSSRTSLTNDDDFICEDGDNRTESFNDSTSEEDGEIDSDSEGYSSYEEDTLYATINKFPVQVIAMECCEDTFDNLIEKTDMTNDEWLSALMQTIMILLTYQKAFAFTHNDLHTNNIMYTKTEKKHIYYLYKNTYYKVPTFGRIFKIIDFGRSIYKFKTHLFCSDSYQPGGDASTQYNTEPYFNESKPRIEPNYSFDLCRLACSLYDFILDDSPTKEEIAKLKPFAKIIREWCLDDNGLNVLYKTNGAERYPGFKLYKMIARQVHTHTPKAQLERAEFAKYAVSKSNVKRGEPVINIDAIPCCF